jgi:hypothetical protein
MDAADAAAAAAGSKGSDEEINGFSAMLRSAQLNPFLRVLGELCVCDISSAVPSALH